ncbi:MAG: flagellar hook-associated protein FlgK [Candidatus Zixiibacteriota bacterium]
MAGLFQGIELGKRALLAQQLCLQTVGHNIANVNTPGFTRQRVTLTTTLPERHAAGMVGTGVTAGNVRHVRDLLLGVQFRRENKSLGQWSYREKILTQIEAVFAEPNDNTLSDLLNSFWDAWSDLSTDPRSTSHRAILIESTQQVTARFQQMAAQLGSLREQINTELVAIVEDVNSYAAEIARLNKLIASQELGEQHANDLRDTRDRLIDELSELIDVNTVGQPNGQVTVMVGALAIVDGGQSLSIKVESMNENGVPTHKLLLGNSTIEIRSINGRLKGLLDMRDETIPKYMSELDRVALTLVEQVNALHVTGYGLDGVTGREFFDPTTTGAADIRLNLSLVDNPDRIGASQSGEVGDNSVALAIQDLRNRLLMANGTTTLNNYYNGVVSRLGMETVEACDNTESFGLLVHQIHNARESVQGVSLDEEMANMVKLQHAYDAAARVITTMDEALDTVIFRMGVTGQ